MKNYVNGALAALLLASSAMGQVPPGAAKSPDAMTPAELAAWRKANGSYYVQCDGQPNNMTAGESAARLIALAAVVGLLAPPPEAADPAKRKFGADGVEACSRLIDGDKAEGNAGRRIGLILARGAHRIEAKDYAGAIADAELARAAAAEAGLSADPHWQRSRGRGADLLQAAALYRLGRAPEASDVALRQDAALRYNPFPLLGTPQFYSFAPIAHPLEAAHADAINHALPYLSSASADRLEQLGRFADAAVLRDALVDLNAANAPKSIASLPIAQAAVSHALAGHADRAAELAKGAQANFDARKADGKPDRDPAEVIELLDLYNIIHSADGGDVKTARRLFAARSQWVSASFGSTVEVNRRLRQGASPDELIGGLARDPAAMWKARAEESKARLLTTDADNKTLFAMFPAAVKAGDYESVAKNAWKVEKSPWVLKPKKPDPDSTGWDTLFAYAGNPSVMPEAYALHAALLARSRGHAGYVMLPVFANTLFAARIRTGNAGDPGLPAPFFNESATVIAALSPAMPDPVELAARKAARDKR